MLRLSVTLISLLLTIILPWWLSLLILLGLVLAWPWYYEAVFLVLVYDLIYGNDYFWLTMAIIIIIPMIEELKKRLYVFS
jgi:hypothetical protein